MKLFNRKSLENLLKLNIVECKECGVLLNKRGVQEIPQMYGLYEFEQKLEKTFYYCRSHKRPYDLMVRDTYCSYHYYKVIPSTKEQRIEVREDGKKLKKII